MTRCHATSSQFDSGLRTGKGSLNLSSFRIQYNKYQVFLETKHWRLRVRLTTWPPQIIKTGHYILRSLMNFSAKDSVLEQIFMLNFKFYNFTFFFFVNLFLISLIFLGRKSRRAVTSTATNTQRAVQCPKVEPSRPCIATRRTSGRSKHHN